jgi:hypothetical protein
MEAVDDLSHYPNLVEVNFANNPLQVHAELQKMICEANPLLEIVNKRQLHEIGYRQREEIKKLREEIISYDQPTTGTTAGDRFLAQG